MNILTDQQLTERERKLARLRSRVFDGSEAEQEQIGREIERVKLECADTWNARHQQIEGDKLTRMGY